MVELNKQFDVNGPLGFHITGHLLALVGLIVACFAITGYITFRDRSVPYKALDIPDGSIPSSALKPFTELDLDGVFYQRAYDCTVTATAVTGVVTNNDVVFPQALVNGLPPNTELVVVKMDVLNALAADATLTINCAPVNSANGTASTALSADMGPSNAVSSTLTPAGPAAASTDATNSSLYIGAVAGAQAAVAVGNSLRVRFILRALAPLPAKAAGV